MLKLFLFLTFLFILSYNAFSQHCAFDQKMQEYISQDSSIIDKLKEIEGSLKQFQKYKSDSILKIPVVFHIIYNSSEQNVSNRQIISQLKVLNEDYRKLNLDTGITLPEFSSVDSRIEFCLAGIDPEGNKTNGVTRTSILQSKIGQSNQLYQVQAVWDSKRYLNIYVCEIGDGISGYSSFPGLDSSKDAVVIDYSNFGRIGKLSNNYDLGRTTTHEVGHWLGLYHIWGKNNSTPNCSDDDMVMDTPDQDIVYTKCPTNPKYSCGSKDMLSNFMGYVYDQCMAAFTDGQTNRMHAMLQSFRPEIGLAMPCSYSLPLDSGIQLSAASISIFPNPSSGKYIINSTAGYIQNYDFELYNIEGKRLADPKIEYQSDNEGILYLKYPAGLYLLKIMTAYNSKVVKIQQLRAY